MNEYATKLRRNTDTRKNDYRMLSTSPDHDAFSAARDSAGFIKIPRGNTTEILGLLGQSFGSEGRTLVGIITGKARLILGGHFEYPVFTSMGENFKEAFRSTLPEQVLAIPGARSSQICVASKQTVSSTREDTDNTDKGESMHVHISRKKPCNVKAIVAGVSVVAEATTEQPLSMVKGILKTKEVTGAHAAPTATNRKTSRSKSVDKPNKPEGTKPKKLKGSNVKKPPKTAEEVEGIEGEDGVDVNLKGPWAAFADPFLGFVNKGSHKEAEARGKRFPTQVMFAWGPKVSRNTAQMITLVSNPLPPCFNRRS